MYRNRDNAEQNIADELAIYNMLIALNNPEMLSELSVEEKKNLFKAIKAHLMMNASIILNDSSIIKK